MLTDEDLRFVEQLFKSQKPFNERGWGLQLIREIRELHRKNRSAKIEGIKLAAEVAKDYDKLSYHTHLVSECILGKLNVMKGKPRKNPAAKKITEALDTLERRVESVAGTTRFLALAAKRELVKKKED